jgi:hypothetical protein
MKRRQLERLVALAGPACGGALAFLYSSLLPFPTLADPARTGIALSPTLPALIMARI